MSLTYEIDNEAPFQLNSFDPRAPLQQPPSVDGMDPGMSFTSFGAASSGVLMVEDQFSSDGVMGQHRGVGASADKGKGVSQPMPIVRSAVDTADDLFSMSPLEEPILLGEGTESSATYVSSFHEQSLDPALHYGSPLSMGMDNTDLSIHFKDFSVSESHGMKGKAREMPPSLPPLTFTPGFEYSAINWPSPSSVSTDAGPSSYGSDYTLNTESVPKQSQPFSTAISPPAPFLLTRVPSRRRSLSNLSIRSTPSIAVRSVSGIKLKLEGSKRPGNLARKLLFKKRGEPDSPASDGILEERRENGLNASCAEAEVGKGSCFLPWRLDAHVRPKSAYDLAPLRPLSQEVRTGKATVPTQYANGRSDIRGKVRSYSYPISPLDIIPQPTEIFKPIPLVPRDLFDELLPREVKLNVLKLLVISHEMEHEELVASGQWTALKASSTKNRWVGRDRGIRELVKVSRVSKLWRDIAFDGQLWANLELRSFPRLSHSSILRITDASGAFIKSIDFTGHTRLSPETLFKISDSLCLQPSPFNDQPTTQLTNINLQGCSSITTNTLHDLLQRSPSLQTLCLKGLDAVTNTTCDILSTKCPLLVSLNMNRCRNVNANGLRSLTSAFTVRGEHLRLVELRISGLKGITDDVMAALGRAAPNLEVLDLSYTSDLHNSALDAFVSCSDEEPGVATILLNSRDMGRDLGDMTKYRRRVTRLRHISLSFCVLLTDIACTNLAHCVPNLEIFEMAGIGPNSEIKDEGLIRLLSTTPRIRKLDLEDAGDITDALIRAITPSVPDCSQSGGSDAAGQPGYALEHLVVSHAINITSESLLNLIRNCPRLRVLEADSTRMSGTTMKEFIRLARSRQMADARVVAIDCRGITESVVSDVSDSTRPRLGWRAYEAKKLAYLDGRDEEGLTVGQDECDEKRVVVKTFYSWETVDAVRAARDRKRKSNSRRAAQSSGSGSEDHSGTLSSGRARWWSPGGRLRSGNNSPTLLDMNNDRDGCRIM